MIVIIALAQRLDKHEGHSIAASFPPLQTCPCLRSIVFMAMAMQDDGILAVDLLLNINLDLKR
jgi:hypothetical protein